MIVDIKGNRIVFGMEWHAMLNASEAQKYARRESMSHYLASESNHFFGTLNHEDRAKKITAPIFSAAVIFSERVKSDGSNTVGIFKLEENLVVFIGIENGRPLSDYDQVVEVEKWPLLLARFRKLTEESGRTCKVIGDVELDGIVSYSINELYDEVSQIARLTKVSSGLVAPAVAMMVIVVVLLGAMHAYGLYKEKKRQQEIAEQAAKKKTSLQLYLEAMQVKSEEFVLPLRHIPQLMDWVSKFPLQIGGWPLTKVVCDVQVSQSLNCLVNFARGPHSEVTNQTYLDAAPEQFKNVSIDSDGKTIQATVSFNQIRFLKMHDVFSMASAEYQERVDFGSFLQRLSDFGNQEFGKFSMYGVPPTANAAELVEIAYTSTQYKFEGMLMSLPLMVHAPGYVTAEKITFEFAQEVRGAVFDSFAKVRVDGSVFSKPNKG